jgi:enoyl-CoA hydratase
MSLITTEINKNVAIVTLNDPKRRNALSTAMADALKATFSQLESSTEVRAAVVTGAPPAFSAGADLNDLENATPESLRRIYAGFLSVARFPLVTIAAVNGPAVGAGLNLALSCDIRLAGRSARFESRFIDLALHPGGGHTWMLRQLLGPQGANAMVLCGEALDGEQAAARGLAWSCVDDGALLEEAVRLASHTAAAPREMQRRLKATLRSMCGTCAHGEAVAWEMKQQLWSMDQPEFRERLAALKRRISRPDKK